jgi:hypothetical protein
MTTATPTWQELFQDQRHALLGQLTRPSRNQDVRSLADEEVVLLGGASEAARLSKRPQEPPREVRCVTLTPGGRQQSLPEFQQLLELARGDHPGAELAGFGPLQAPLLERYQGLDRAVILAGRLDCQFESAAELSACASLSLPLTAVLVYTPQVSPRALEQAVAGLGELASLVSVVPLPAGAGDRIPLAGLTTAGNIDAMVISALRLLLPTRVRVRASWAALGWKVAQVALAYGADELAGWTAAETLAYSGRVRAASRVERQELNAGLAEARARDIGWPIHSSGGSL